MSQTGRGSMNGILTGMVRALASLGVSLGKEGVYLDELGELPRLQVRQGALTVQITHSRRNSGKEIYRLEVLTEGSSYLLRGFQRLVTGTAKGPVFRHQATLARMAPGDDPRAATFVWMDPDGRRHPLTIEGWKRGVDREPAAPE